MSNDRHLRCSFCGKSKDSVRKFISGPSVYICNECIALCNEILAEDEEREVADAIAGILELGDAAGKIWLLVDEAGAVSTVLTSIVDDAVCVWCMGTPARFARRGYGRALLTDVLLRAKLEGASIGLLGATPAGKALYDATGWTTLEQWQLFLRAESAQFGH